LGATWFEFLVRRGLVIAIEGGWLSPFQLLLVNELYVFADRPSVEPNAIMALGPTTEVLARASFPQTDIGTALDLGCGCGVLALLLARVATQVVATDLNPRAVAMTRLNAALNGIENVSVRQGDLFAPVAGERFDLIVSQPPFLGCADGESRVLFLHGGRRGDELTRRIVEELPAYLSAQGTGFVLADFGLGAGERVAARLPALPSLGVTILVAGKEVDLDVNAALYIANGQFLSGDALWEQTRRQVEHARACGVDHLVPALLIVEAGETGVRELAVAPERWNDLDRSLIDPLIVAARGLDDPWTAWQGRRLRLVDGTRVVHEYPFSEHERGRLILRSGSGSLLPDPVVGESVLPLIAAVHGAASVAAAVPELPGDVVAPILAQLVLHGILRISA
jgi:SAM-dependent methyltransferase